jgi:hypothetical protein
LTSAQVTWTASQCTAHVSSSIPSVKVAPVCLGRNPCRGRGCRRQPDFRVAKIAPCLHGGEIPGRGGSGQTNDHFLSFKGDCILHSSRFWPIKVKIRIPHGRMRISRQATCSVCHSDSVNKMPPANKGVQYRMASFVPCSFTSKTHGRCLSNAFCQSAMMIGRPLVGDLNHFGPLE